MANFLGKSIIIWISLLVFLICLNNVSAKNSSSTTIGGAGCLVYYVLCFSTNMDQQNLTIILDNLIPPLTHSTCTTFLQVRIIVSTDIISDYLLPEINLQNYIDNNITIENTGVFLDENGDDDNEMWNRLNETYRILQSRRTNREFENVAINLLTDYYSQINDSVEIISANHIFHALVYDYQTFEEFQEDKIPSFFTELDNDKINPFATARPYWGLTDSTTPSNLPTTPSTTLTSTSNMLSSTIIISDISKNGSNKVIIIISVCAAAVILILITVICFFNYRRRKRNIQSLQKSIKKCEEEITDIRIDFWELTWDKIQIIDEQLGSGAYGQVLKGKLLKKSNYFQTSETQKSLNEENVEVAIKTLHKYADENAKKNFENEIQLMKLISGHDNIINMIGCITLEKKICLILEFCPFRDLLQYIKSQKNDTPKNIENAQNEFLIFAWQISQGLRFLGSKNIIHRDLAARNILIDKDKNAKISDFGLCVQRYDKSSNLSSDNCVGRLPIKWLAIESLKEHEFSLQSDIWSFGMILYEIHSFGEIPFKNVEISQLMEHLEAGNRPEKPEFCSEEMHKIMIKCWDKTPSLRPTSLELITTFTILLERAAEGYEYLALLKTEKKV